ncbi:hypothetical protein GLW07_01250 [Bacillus hwajinpoensis]|uniref:Methyltransferase domain-containing protein n=1 Tax=Guptibacillus hwajinpoensis TaxID=208199 RepID=A0A845ENJ8_9BACL|nr:hypothetical protein [Pseudalkalibacillus hwajinpoensis]MYL61971.1 hypothetical protein [Pseudalkalibacillus hwajinpoensis]
MLKNQLVHLQSETLSIPEPQRSRLRWCGSRASGKHILHISQTPGILSIVNEDTQLDMVNIIVTRDDLSILDHPSTVNSTSSFWTGDLSGEIPFPTNYFDVLIIEDALAEILPVHNDEVQRLIKPNGKIIVTEKLRQAIQLKDEWVAIFSSNEKIDQRIDEHYVNLVLRNVIKAPEHSENAVEILLNEMQERIDRINKDYAKAIHEKLEEKKTEELARLQEKNKLVNSIPFIRKKHEALIAQLELSPEEKKELSQKSNETVIHTKKCDLHDQLSRFQTVGNITIVFGENHLYRKNSLVFSHQLVDVLSHNKGKNVVYVHGDESQGFAPIYRAGANLIQISRTEFHEHLHLFDSPEMYVTVQDLQLAKRLGRLQWKKWSVYYFPEEIADQEIHSFLVGSLNPDSFITRMNSYLPFEKKERELKGIPIADEEKRIVVGYVGNLERVDYRAVKEMLVANQKVAVELIGYNLPSAIPINTKRLMIKEYTNDDELRKRVGKWTFGFLPFRQSEPIVSLKMMKTIGIPLLVTNDWSASIQDQKVWSLDKEETLSRFIEEAIGMWEGREIR